MHNEINQSINPLSRDNTTAWRGIACLIVLLYHIGQIATGTWFYSFTYPIGILAVGVFFFLSGYGLYLQVSDKPDYLKGFFLHRLPSILVPFFVVSILYNLYFLIRDGSFNINTFLNFRSTFMGVSYSWYVVALLVLYIAFYVICKIFAKQEGNKKHLYIFIAMFGFLCIYTLACIVLDMGNNWFIPIFMFLFGMIAAWFAGSGNINKFLQFRSWKAVLIFSCFLLLTCGFVVIDRCKSMIFSSGKWILVVSFVFKNLAQGCFVLALFFLGLTACKCRLFALIGKISYEIYLLQGLSILIFRNIPSIRENILLFGVCVFVSTIVVSIIFHYIDQQLLKLLKRGILRMQGKNSE